MWICVCLGRLNFGRHRVRSPANWFFEWTNPECVDILVHFLGGFIVKASRLPPRPNSLAFFFDFSMNRSGYIYMFVSILLGDSSWTHDHWYEASPFCSFNEALCGYVPFCSFNEALCGYVCIWTFFGHFKATELETNSSLSFRFWCVVMHGCVSLRMFFLCSAKSGHVRCFSQVYCLFRVDYKIRGVSVCFFSLVRVMGCDSDRCAYGRAGGKEAWNARVVRSRGGSWFFHV